MSDENCIGFLQTALPRLGLHWPGFRKVRGLVRKRLGRRLRELRISGLRAYLPYLENHREEWDRLDELCRNAVLSYLAPPLRRQVVERVISRLRPGGALVVGIHEPLPQDPSGMISWPGARAIYRKIEAGALP